MTHLLNELISLAAIAITFTFLLRKSPRPSIEPETAIVQDLRQEVIDTIYGANLEVFPDTIDYWAENDSPLEKPNTPQDYLSLSNTKLRALCKERGIMIPHANTKSALVAVLSETDA